MIEFLLYYVHSRNVTKTHELRKIITKNIRKIMKQRRRVHELPITKRGLKVPLEP